MMKLKPTDQTTRRTRCILDKSVCAHGFRKLLGLGTSRYARLLKCAQNDIPPPVDGRERRRRDDGSNPKSIHKRALIVDFLQELLHTLAEPMPETSQSQKRKAPDGGPDSIPRSMKFKRSRGKRPNRQFRKFAFKGKKLDDRSQQPMKLLPPGSFTDYLRMLQSKHPEERFSLKLFCTAP